jgi:urease accessory protein
VRASASTPSSVTSRPLERALEGGNGGTSLITSTREPPVVAGSEGLLRLIVAVVAGRTRIVDLECRGPVQVLRCHYLDAGAPDMAFVMMASPGGGVLQGDHLTIDVRVQEGARLNLATQSATRLYRMPHGGARIEMRFEVERAAYLEHLPDPWVPFADSRVSIETEVVADPTATILLSEVVAPGRAARGEILQQRRFESCVVVRRPSGQLLFTDATVLDSGAALDDPGMLGAGRAVGSFHAIGPNIAPGALRAAMPASNGYAGASSLPNDAGAWLRVIAHDTGEAARVVAAAHAAVRTAVVGPVPPSRRP